jgi:hypothetical protein
MGFIPEVEYCFFGIARALAGVLRIEERITLWGLLGRVSATVVLKLKLK